MDFPFAARLALGDPRLALVEQLERMIHRFTDFALGRRRDAVAGVERGVDGGFEQGLGHRSFLRKRDVYIGDLRGFVGIWGRGVKAMCLPGDPSPLVIAGLDV